MIHIRAASPNTIILTCIKEPEVAKPWGKKKTLGAVIRLK